MTTLLYIVEGIFALMTVGLISGYTASKHIGLLLAAIVFGGAAAISFHLMAWWPLAVGVVLAWVLRLLGLDPSPGR
jgi:hypothetical protein